MQAQKAQSEGLGNQAVFGYLRLCPMIGLKIVDFFFRYVRFKSKANSGETIPSKFDFNALPTSRLICIFLGRYDIK